MKTKKWESLLRLGVLGCTAAVVIQAVPVCAAADELTVNDPDTVIQMDEELPVSGDEEETAGVIEMTEVEEDLLQKTESYDMYRMYNPNSGEHFYTANYVERDMLLKAGWSYEGIGWTAPGAAGSDPVYRLYNENAGDHHYTMSKGERDSLVRLGWKDEGIGWYSSRKKEIPLYRQYNKNAVAGSHNYTTNEAENTMLVSQGWDAEGIGWYGINDPDPTITHPITILDGYDFSSVYDFNYYTANNETVREKYANDDIGALTYFRDNGLNNKDKAKENFDQSEYDKIAEYIRVHTLYPEACAKLDQVGWSLEAAFNWAASIPYVSSGRNASAGCEYFAKWTFSNSHGDCYGMSAAFYQMAKALGYDAHWVAGYVPLNGGGMGGHGWVEISGYKGGTYVFDPDFQHESGRNGFAIYYGQGGTWRYSGYSRQN
ncbi:MAG: transglutaminase domain-containing protein [Eubacteriales bacterium]|nr:transglutaminase domain-containing protein [Eubacteriales bacterium]